MKDKRNYILCLLTVLLCACMAHTANAASSPSLSASADAAGVSAGDYVNISVSLSGNPSISTLGMALNYDGSVLSYDSASWSGGFSGSDMQMASDTGSEVNLSVVCDGSYSADGTVVTVRFQAVSDSSSIPVTLSLRDMADADLNAVTGCKVSSQVRVPDAVDSGNNTETEDSGSQAADKTEEPEDVKSSETNPDAAEESNGASGQQTADIGSVDTGNGQGASYAAAANAQGENAGSGVQRVSVQNTQQTSSADAGSAQPDQNYKTGAGIGNDIFLMIAALCGILALALTVKRHGEEKK